MRRISRIIIMAALCSAPDAAYAIDCTITDLTPVSFGAYDVFAPSPQLTNGAVILTCTSVLGSDNITVDLSTGDASTYGPRQLTGTSGAALNYNLYMDAPRLLVWGDESAGTSHFGPANPPDGAPLQLTV